MIYLNTMLNGFIDICSVLSYMSPCVPSHRQGSQALFRKPRTATVQYENSFFVRNKFNKQARPDN